MDVDVEVEEVGVETVSEDDGAMLDVDDEDEKLGREAGGAPVVAVFVAVDVSAESDNEPDIDPDKPPLTKPE